MDDGEFCHEAELSQAFQEPHSAEYSVFDGESSVFNGESSVFDGESSDSYGESSVSEGESSVSDGESSVSEGEYYLSEGDNTLSSGQKELLLWYWSHIDSDDSLVSGGDNVAFDASIPPNLDSLVSGGDDVAFDASISPNLRSDRLTMLARSIQTVRKVQKEPSGKFKKFKARFFYLVEICESREVIISSLILLLSAINLMLSLTTKLILLINWGTCFMLHSNIYVIN